MNWPRIWVLRGANVWAPSPMLEVELNLTSVAEDPEQIQAAVGRLRAWLPTLGEADSAEGSALLAQTFQRLTLALQQLVGCSVSAGVVRPAGRANVFRVAVEFERATQRPDPRDPTVLVRREFQAR